MPSRTSNFRGKRTHGRGKKAGRGKGKRGGCGNAGAHKHRYIWFVKYEPNHFGRKGFHRHTGKKVKIKTINVGQVQEKLTSLLIEKKAEERNGKIYIDLESLGYTKLLGGGKVTVPIHVKVPQATSTAMKKIESIGGKVLTASAGADEE